MRWLLGMLAVGSVQAYTWGDEAPASPTFAQAWRGALSTGTDVTPESFSMFWLAAPNSERAAAAGHLVAMGSNPLSAGWAKLAYDNQVRYTRGLDGGNPSSDIKTSAPALYSGSLPVKPMDSTLPGNTGGGGMGGGMGGGGGGMRRSEDGQPLVAAPQALDLGGEAFFGAITVPRVRELPPPELIMDEPILDWSVSSTDGSTTFGHSSAKDPGADPFLTPPIVPDPLPDPQPKAELGTVSTPEPTTIGLSVIGLLGVAVSRWKTRLRRKA